MMAPLSATLTTRAHLSQPDDSEGLLSAVAALKHAPARSRGALELARSISFLVVPMPALESSGHSSKTPHLCTTLSLKSDSLRPPQYLNFLSPDTQKTAAILCNSDRTGAHTRAAPKNLNAAQVIELFIRPEGRSAGCDIQSQLDAISDSKPGAGERYQKSATGAIIL